jgi:hypothetical protein
MPYRVFQRTWWKENPSWPHGLEPVAGRKTTVAVVETEEEARDLCKKLLAETHRTAKQIRLSLKGEYEQA